MQKNLYIHLTMPDGQQRVAGRLLYEQFSDGMFQSFFRYEPSWLGEKTAFPLDPIHLPLANRVFQLKSRTGLWGVFEDALPDAWGRRLLHARHRIDVSRGNNIELLLLTGWAEPGATGFGERPECTFSRIKPMEMEQTDQALAASEDFEKSGGIINLPDFFVSGGSSAGGARPKVLASQGRHHYLVKFPSINDPAPDLIPQLEYFGLCCARRAGIPVPEFFLITTGSQRTALAVKRFDITRQGGRVHFLSFQSLAGTEEQLGLPYARMAEIITTTSVDPEFDLRTLFKQMVLNILLRNCDDHLKNFSMLYSPSENGYRLTPAYDIVPNLWQREHILSIGNKTTDITLDDLLREGRGFALSLRTCRGLIRETAGAVNTVMDSLSNTLLHLEKCSPLAGNLIEAIHDNLLKMVTGHQDMPHGDH